MRTTVFCIDEHRGLAGPIVADRGNKTSSIKVKRKGEYSVTPKVSRYRLPPTVGLFEVHAPPQVPPLRAIHTPVTAEFVFVGNQDISLVTLLTPSAITSIC